MFRFGRSGAPFLRVMTRENGVYVVRFSAKPSEIIRSRSSRLGPHARKFVYEEPPELVCVPGEVRVRVPASLLALEGADAYRTQGRMTAMTQPLFRSEVLEAKRGSWLGGISLALQEQERAQTQVRGARMVKAPATGVVATPVVKPGQAIAA